MMNASDASKINELIHTGISVCRVIKPSKKAASRKYRQQTDNDL